VGGRFHLGGLPPEPRPSEPTLRCLAPTNRPWSPGHGPRPLSRAERFQELRRRWRNGETGSKRCRLQVQSQRDNRWIKRPRTKLSSGALSLSLGVALNRARLAPFHVGDDVSRFSLAGKLFCCVRSSVRFEALAIVARALWLPLHVHGVTVLLA